MWLLLFVKPFRDGVNPAYGLGVIKGSWFWVWGLISISLVSEQLITVKGTLSTKKPALLDFLQQVTVVKERRPR